MGLLDFLDARRGIARWAGKWFKHFKAEQTDVSDQAIAQISLGFRYRSFASDALRVYIAQRADQVHTIHDLCYLIAEAECLSLINPLEKFNQMHDQNSPLQRTYRTIDSELAKLGYRSGA